MKMTQVKKVWFKFGCNIININQPKGAHNPNTNPNANTHE